MYQQHRQAVFGQGKMQHFKLNTGATLPAVGLGTWQSEPGQVEKAVEVALDAGYRHLDCAFVYGNENEVGNGLKNKIADGVVTREDVFITGKLWATFMRPDLVPKGLQKSLEALQLSYVDLYLMHWPVTLQDGDNVFPVDENGKGLTVDADYLDSYKEMEKLMDEGLVKAIGVSNFNCRQIQRLLDNCRIKPSVLQVEVHPYHSQQELIDFCTARDIHVTAYSPLGSPTRPWAPKGEKGLLQHPMITAIGDKYKKSPGQIVIRYAMQRGISLVPKSVTPSRIQENIQVTDFQLSAADMKVISNMNRDERLIQLDIWKHSKYYPFNEDSI